MKKLLTLLFALALAVSLSSVTFAQDTGSADKKDETKKAEKKEKKKKKKAEKKEEKKEEAPKQDEAPKQ